MLKTAILAGTHSGCGKTTVMLALLQYLKSKSLEIATFKVGPDFLDPFWHQAITGKPSYNLDTQMMGADECCYQLYKHSQDAKVVLIEGVMGLFDGRAGVGGVGSSADLAKVLQIPVILIVDAKGMAGSIVPLVSGFCDYAKKSGFRISGIIGNRVGSEHHAQMLSDLLNNHNLPPLVAWLEKNAPELPERHLGLKRPEESEVPNFLPFFHVGEELLTIAFAEKAETKPIAVEQLQRLKGKTVAVANDAACCFIYPANIDWLKEQGATVQFFSPLKSEPIPEHADVVWLPGGYPELYAEALSQSKTWTSLHEFINTNKPVLAECGGAMILGKELIDIEGKTWRMAGVFSYRSVMQEKLASLGYREEANGMKGHEFHYSRRENAENLQACFNLEKGDKGVRFKNVHASYIHWYFASAPAEMVKWLV
jgi:cobyrinic acid a,c-diamide synthase